MRTSLVHAALSLLVLAASAGAKPEYSRIENQECLHCHLRRDGGKGFLSPTGKYYQNYRRLPPPGISVHPKPAAGPAPANAWHPESEAARTGSVHTRIREREEAATKALMARWTRSLGAKNCYYCHADRLHGATPGEVEEARRRHEVAIRHQEMTNTINATLGGGERVTCYTCHLGGRGPVTMP